MKKILLFSILTLLTVLVTSAAITYSRELEERAILGDNVAMWQLSQCYRFSLGCDRDLDKADYWLDRAAEEGNVDALNQKVLLDDKGKRLTDAKRRELAAVERQERERLLKSKEEQRLAEERRKQEEQRLAEEQRRQEELKKQEQIKKQTFTVNGVSFVMVEVKGGTFTMGATSEQGSDAESNEKPAHNVTLSSYYIGETEVTQELWKAVMGKNPSRFKGNKYPVERVSWEDCQKFIKKLNKLTGERFRLPTEAEWEFAARGGNLSKGYKYNGSNNLGKVAWYNGNRGFKGSSSPDYSTHAVGTKLPNELGLYDMSGNVWEWCSDWYGDYSSSAQSNPTGPSSAPYLRVGRGGCWSDLARRCRVSSRDYFSPDFRCNCLGLRLAL